MNTEELKQIQLSRQYITKNASKETVIRNLCGIQCQFLSNAMHSLIIRCNEKISNESLGDDIIKNWTIRGTDYTDDGVMRAIIDCIKVEGKHDIEFQFKCGVNIHETI